MRRLVRALSLCVALATCVPASGHAPQFAGRADPAPDPGRRQGNPLAMKVNDLNRLSGLLDGIASTVVTELNDDVNTLAQLATQVTRQNWMRARNQQAGFGMRRWNEDFYEKTLEDALSKAEGLLDKYCARLPSVVVTIGGEIAVGESDGPIPVLAQRKEYLLLDVRNATDRPQRLEAAGEAAGKPIGPVACPAPPQRRTCVMVPFLVARPGPFEIRLSLRSPSASAAVVRKADAARACRLTLNIVDAATGKPCAARAYVLGSDGRYAIADDRVVTLAGGKNVQTFGYADGRMEVLLPAGRVKIAVRKGFEHEVAQIEADLQADKTVEVKLTRWIDMPARGWWNGDTHTHWVKTNWYENGDADWLDVHSRAEDIWVNNDLVLKHWWKNVKTAEFPRGLVADRPDAFPVGRIDKYSRNGRIVWVAEEYRNDEVFGHMVFLRIDKLIEPVSTGFMGGPQAVHYPPNSYKYDEVHAAGGIVHAAHDVTGEVPIQVILDKLDVQDAYRTGRYYDLLNCGFRLPVACGSDYPANLMGFARVYVHCGAELTYDKWIDNLAAGRTFVSSGSVIFLTADGKQIGDTIEVEPGSGREVVVAGEAMCRNPLERVEIVCNGQVAKTIAAGPGGSKRIAFEEKLALSGPGWLAARAFPRGKRSWWGQADGCHTSPIYVKCGQHRLVRPESVRRLIEVVRTARNVAAQSDMFASEAQKKEVLDYFDDGIGRYEKLLDANK